MSALREHQAADPLLTPEEAGLVLGVSAYTVKQWARTRKIPAIRVGKFWRFRESSLQAWIQDQERAAR